MMSAGRLAILQKYTVAIGGQALLSGFNFVLNVLLVRWLVPADYGIFALAIVVSIVGISLNSALASAPLSVYTPGLTRSAIRQTLETTFSMVSVLLSAAIAVAAFAAATLLTDGWIEPLAFAAFAATWTQRFYIRSIAFARRRPSAALIGDISYIMLSAFCLVIGWNLLASSDQLPVPLLALAIGNFGAGQIGLALLGIPARPAIRWSLMRRYRTFWPKIRWSLAGVLSTSLQENAHSLIVTALAGPAAFAPLAAGQIIFGPVRVALQAAQMVMRPEQVVAIADRNKASVRRNLFVTTGALSLGTLIVWGVIGLAWESIHGFLFAENYAGEPMALIVFLWGAIILMVAGMTGASSLLQAFKEFRILAIANIIGSILSVLLVSLFLLIWQPAMSLIGTAIAALFATIFIFVASLREIERQW